MLLLRTWSQPQSEQTLPVYWLLHQVDRWSCEEGIEPSPLRLLSSASVFNKGWWEAAAVRSFFRRVCVACRVTRPRGRSARPGVWSGRTDRLRMIDWGMFVCVNVCLCSDNHIFRSVLLRETPDVRRRVSSMFSSLLLYFCSGISELTCLSPLQSGFV